MRPLPRSSRGQTANRPKSESPLIPEAFGFQPRLAGLWFFARSGSGARSRCCFNDWTAAFSGESQTGDLPFSVGRSFADGPVRLQASTKGQAGHRAADIDPHGPAYHNDDFWT